MLSQLILIIQYVLLAMGTRDNKELQKQQQQQQHHQKQERPKIAA